MLLFLVSKVYCKSLTLRCYPVPGCNTAVQANYTLLSLHTHRGNEYNSKVVWQYLYHCVTVITSNLQHDFSPLNQSVPILKYVNRFRCDFVAISKHRIISSAAKCNVTFCLHTDLCIHLFCSKLCKLQGDPKICCCCLANSHLVLSALD